MFGILDTWGETHEWASLTPPLPSLLNFPLPRPPARTWAFIIDGASDAILVSVEPGVGDDGVDLLITETTCLACSGVVTRNPGGTGSLNWIVLALRVPCMNGYLTSCSSLCEWCSSRFNRRTCVLMGA